MVALLYSFENCRQTLTNQQWNHTHFVHQLEWIELFAKNVQNGFIVCAAGDGQWQQKATTNGCAFELPAYLHPYQSSTTISSAKQTDCHRMTYELRSINLVLTSSYSSQLLFAYTKFRFVCFCAVIVDSRSLQTSKKKRSQKHVKRCEQI